ncbi:MAG: hypothetical protein ACE5EM_10135, partial [Sphingomonadales bacterium]
AKAAAPSAPASSPKLSSNSGGSACKINGWLKRNDRSQIFRYRSGAKRYSKGFTVLLPIVGDMKSAF